jgi:hypothetical protein
MENAQHIQKQKKEAESKSTLQSFFRSKEFQLPQTLLSSPVLVED